MLDRKRRRKRLDPPMLKFTDGPLMKFAALKLGLRIISRGRWK